MYAWFGAAHWWVGSQARRVSDAGMALRSERGQGTVEYVGLVLLVAVLMGGMVAAVGGLNSLPGKELAEAITKKIVQAVQKVAFAD
jgi:hypothetical protein